MQSNQATPEGIDETVSMLGEGVKNLAMNAALDQIEGWRLRLEVSGVPEFEPIADGLGRLQNRLTSGEVDARGQAVAFSRTSGIRRSASLRPMLADPSPAGSRPSP